ncbi:adenylosuccinate lyase [Synergistales bacterium]|nr:adenylosuccinate lyase [Synergistales bacterium]
MIDRYATKEMSDIWSEENRLDVMLKVELAVCEAWSKLGEIPSDALDDILKKASVSPSRVAEIEAETHHDVIAFVSAVAETIGENGRFVHLGLTSSDVLDTASSIMLRQSLSIISSNLSDLKRAILSKAQENKYLPCIGRTHGIHAEPMTLGLKFLNWAAELGRDTERIALAEKQIAVGKISGAVGTYAMCPPEIERMVCVRLSLSRPDVANQILQRDRHAQVLSALSLLGCGLERMATEIRHLQRTEVAEIFEPFAKKQKGSSAMPHKRNPIKCERVCGMARLLRGYAATAMENVALWHERDISHSSTERVIWPDSFNIAHFMLKDMKSIVDGLVIDKEKLQKNLDLTGGAIYSQRVLLTLVDKFKLSREEAYAIVQSNAMRTLAGEGSFFDLLKNDERLKGLIDEAELRGLFDVGFYTKHVDYIFKNFEQTQ